MNSDICCSILVNRKLHWGQATILPPSKARFTTDGVTVPRQSWTTYQAP